MANSGMATLARGGTGMVGAARCPRILYIEDDETLAALVRARLRRHAMEVAIAGDGEDGLAALGRTRFDAVVIDYLLPEMDGLEVLKVISAMADAPPAIMLSAVGKLEIAVAAMKLGAADYVVKDVDGTFIDLLPAAIGRIIEQRRLREALSESEERLQRCEETFRAFIEQVQLVVVSLDAEGTITYCNEHLLQLTGWRQAEVIGRNWFDMFLPPESREQVRHVFDTVLAEGGAAVPPHHESEMLTRDGRRLVISWDDVRLSDAAGRPAGLTGAGLDITERRRAEEALRRLNDELNRRVDERTAQLMVEIADRLEAQRATDNFFAVSLDLLCIAGTDGYFRRLSPAWTATLGWSTEEMLAVPFLSFVHPDDVRRTQAQVERLAAGHPTVRFENRYRCKDGSYRLLQWTTTPFAGDTLYAVARDLTEQRQQEEAMRQLQAELMHATRLSAMGQMASNLAHELNQPLTAVANYVQAARRMLQAAGTRGPDLAFEAMDKAVAQAHRAGEIIARLREFIKTGEGQRNWEDINALVEKAVDLGLIGAKAMGIDVRLDLAPDLPEVLVEAVPIQQVVLNLVRNSVEAMAQSARRELTVKTAQAGAGAVRVSVIDTGCGLAREAAERLFAPFVTTKRDGMGLGLSICRAIVEAHGGRIAAVPNPEGGAVFRFTLPVVGETDHEREADHGG